MKAIYLYTMNGILEATAIPCAYGVQIKAKDGKPSIVVTQGTYDRKMQDDKPMFYAC